MGIFDVPGNRTQIGQKQDINRTIIGQKCVCGKVHKSKDTYYKHRKSHPIPKTLEPVHSNVLTDIDLRGEFENMKTKILPKRDESDSGKEKKYECGVCHEQFNALAEGGKCPFCETELGE